MKQLMLTTAMTFALAGGALAQSSDAGLASSQPLETGLASTAAEATSTTVMVPMDSATAGQVEAQAADAPIGTVEPEAGVRVGAPMEDGLRVPAFRASEFAGTSLFAVDPQAVAGARDFARWNSGEQVLDVRDTWEQVGAINDTILSQDGAVRGVLVDVGGFLGIGARTVLIDINDLYFVPNADTADDPDDFFAVAGLTRQQLADMPEWSEGNLVAGYPWGDTPSQAAFEADRASDAVAQGVVASGVVAADNTVVAPAGANLSDTSATAEDLTGSLVVDAAGDTVGRVHDIVLEGDAVSAVVLDVGGFLGIGAHTVAIPVDALTVVRHDNGGVDRVQTAVTRAELEAMPAYNK